VRELGIGYVAYSPLGRDFSQGSSRKKISPKMTIAEIHQISGREFLQESATGRTGESDRFRKGVSPSQLAAWLLAQGDDIVPIPGRSGGTTWKKILPRDCADPKELSQIEAVAPKASLLDLATLSSK